MAVQLLPWVAAWTAWACQRSSTGDQHACRLPFCTNTCNDCPRLSLQDRLEGGFMGRTTKLVNGCYSFWQGSSPPRVQ